MRLGTLAAGIGAEFLTLMGLGYAQPAAPPTAPERVLYVVATSHLDTQWRWTIQDTINQYIPATLRDNFALMERHPGYVFSFEGAFRYQLMREYYRAEYARLKELVRAGRWKVAGSWVDAVDPNIPSPESIIRQALYGNGFFRRELGVTSRDVFLPDCFGFGYALPAAAAHSGLYAFSTQKLTWGSSVKIPFEVGLWEGVDGSALIASLNPGAYVSHIEGDLSLDPRVYATQDLQVAQSGLPVALRYFGTGDVGGAPDEGSVGWLQESLTGAGPTRVVSAAPDGLARDLRTGLTPEQLQRLPRYRGELLMTSHGAGCYTSQAAMKRFNRLNQRWADAAERAALTAYWLGGMAYPREALREAWVRFLWHQFHDDLTGTSIPEAYTFSWNDEVIAINRFADVTSTAVGAVSRGLDTSVAGVPLVVYNPIAIPREDPVDVWLTLPDGPAAVRVVGPDGREVPAQVAESRNGAVRVVFIAGVGPMSLSVFSVEPAAFAAATSALEVSERGLENERYRVRLSERGDIASVYDKRLERELLRGPLTLQLLDDEPDQWSAWEIDYAEIMAPPKAVVGGSVRTRIVEDGPARVVLEVIREALGSKFRQQLRLAAGGASDRLEIEHVIDWRSKGTLLKASFPLASGNQLATYDLGLGVAERGVNRPNLYEVPAQQWADLTVPDGSFGVAILNDSRHGWDHPDPGTLRLSLIHTPRVVRSWSWLDDQASQDLGRHRVVTAIVGHAGDWRAEVPFHGERLNRPLLAWQAPSHAGALGRSFSLLALEGPDGDTPLVAVRALKLAEESQEVVVRLQELTGKPQSGLVLRFAKPVQAVREVNGAEEPLEGEAIGGAFPSEPLPLALEEGTVRLALAAFRPRTLALTLAAPPVVLAPARAQPLTLPFNRDGISDDASPRDGDLDGAGRTIAGDLLAETITSGDLPFRTGPRGDGKHNVVACRGQRLAVPGGAGTLVLVAAATAGDHPAIFLAGETPVELTVHDWAEPVGQWDNRLVAGELVEEPELIAPGYVKSAPVAWVGTHRHSALGENEPYVFTTFFRYRLPVPAGVGSVTLPDDESIVVLAATWVDGEDEPVIAAQPPVEEGDAAVVHLRAPRWAFLKRATVELTSPNPGATIRYTIDGSNPGPTSPAYRAPFSLTETATVKARAFAPGLDDRFVASAEFSRVELQEPEVRDTGGMLPGLSCRLYEGEWRALPDFSALEAAAQMTLPMVGLPAERPAEHFSLLCEGFLRVSEDAVYTLGVRSDDGSQLFLGGELVIDNDGTHDKRERRTELALGAGLHPIEMRYFQWRYGTALELWLASDHRSYRQVEPVLLFHSP